MSSGVAVPHPGCRRVPTRATCAIMPAMELELTGKLCLVSGASRGIGRAIAHALAREGGRIAAVARGRSDLDAPLGELAGTGHIPILAHAAPAEGAAAAGDRRVRAPRCVAR